MTSCNLEFNLMSNSDLMLIEADRLRLQEEIDSQKTLAERNKLAGQIKTALNNAAFHNKAVDEFGEIDLTIRAKLLIDQVEDLAGRD